MSDLFNRIRENIIGCDAEMDTPLGRKKIIYADWIASGRLYKPIEEKMQSELFPYCANTHTETSYTGALMTRAYQDARAYIKKCVGANDQDCLLFAGTGMTATINKLQRILGLKFPEQFIKKKECTGEDAWRLVYDQEQDRPVVFITHMEHHSNHTSWLETVAKVEIIQPDVHGNVDLDHFAELLDRYKDSRTKIASVTACSNVTGVITPYYEIAKMIHRAGGYCFVDFACSAPYVDIQMHPEDEEMKLDAVFISPHKFLGGPGTPGIVVFCNTLYRNLIPDHPGGGTVYYTNPWNDHKYIPSIEDREDGGTPGFLQGIKAALAFKLKEEIGVENIMAREKELMKRVFDRLETNDQMVILAANQKNRIGAFSFYFKELHYNLSVRILNDYFGIQVRGGCACAGTYGHVLLNIDKERSYQFLEEIECGSIMNRPGWIRLSVHPTLSDEELDYILDSILYIAAHQKELNSHYEVIDGGNNFRHKQEKEADRLDKWVHEFYRKPFHAEIEETA